MGAWVIGATVVQSFQEYLTFLDPHRERVKEFSSSYCSQLQRVLRPIQAIF
jgi:hypothetical protein